MSYINESLLNSQGLLIQETEPEIEPTETPTRAPNEQPEVEPEKMPNEDPGIQPSIDPNKGDDDDDDDDDDPFTETEIGDDPDEIRKKTTIFQLLKAGGLKRQIG